MKKLVILIWSLVMVVLSVRAQNAKVNEKCNGDGDCVSGLKCVTLKNTGDKKCATCTQDRLNTLTERVERYCKEIEPPAVSNQGDVSMQELERKIDLCKECIAARKEMNNDCWNGGDDGHKQQLRNWEEALSNNISIKNDKLSSKRVYYGAKSDYENYMAKVNSSCAKNFKQASEDATRRKSEKYSCSDLESWVRSCQQCVDDYNDLSRYVFKGYMTNKREDELGDYKNYLKNLKEILDHKKSNNLCN